MEPIKTSCKVNMCAQCRHAKEEDSSDSIPRYLCTNKLSKYYNKSHRGNFPCKDGFKHLKMKYKFASFKILD